MPIYLSKLNTKLGAILAKDAAGITSQHVYIPGLGASYTQAQLEAWLKVRSDQLNSIKDYSDAQVKTERDALYGQLSTAGKAVADKIIAGQQYELDSASADYERLVCIILIVFATTP